MEAAFSLFVKALCRFPFFCCVKGVGVCEYKLINLLWRKAPGTLVKRVNSLFRYLTYLREVGSEFPGSESLLYQFLVEQQDKSVAPTRLAGVLESLRFCRHVLDIPELANLTSLRRCSWAAATKRGGVRKQASPFTVVELQVLHKVVCSIDENLWDRIFCGTVLMMVYRKNPTCHFGHHYLQTTWFQ